MTFRFLSILCLLALSVCKPAFAAPKSQEAATSDPAAQCQALLPLAPPVPVPNWQVSAKTVTAFGPDGCEFEQLTFRMSEWQGYSVDRLRFSGLDFRRPLAEGGPFARMKMEASGIQRVGRSGSPGYNYAMSLIQYPLTLTLAVDFDVKSGTFRLKDLNLAGKRFGLLQLSAETAVTMSQMTRMLDESAPQPDIGLKALHLHFENDGAFEGYVAMPLALALLADETDPAGGLAKRIAGIKAELAKQLPRFGADAASTSAALAFVDSFPHPDKPLDFTLSAARPLVTEDMIDVTPTPRLPPGALVIHYGG